MHARQHKRAQTRERMCKPIAILRSRQLVYLGIISEINKKNKNNKRKPTTPSKKAKEAEIRVVG